MGVARHVAVATEPVRWVRRYHRQVPLGHCTNLGRFGGRGAKIPAPQEQRRDRGPFDFGHYDGQVEKVTERTWVGVYPDDLPERAIRSWVVRRDCGAVVMFLGTTRDDLVEAERVEALEYETYPDYIIKSLEEVCAESFHRWPETGRIAVCHRTGRVDCGDASVVVAVSSPHREAAYECARFALDATKASAPIWKQNVVSSGAVGFVQGVPARSPKDVASCPTTR